MVMTRDWPVLHVACWSQGLRSESPLAEAKAVVAAAAEGRLAHCKKPSAAFLSRGGRRRGTDQAMRCDAMEQAEQQWCAGQEGGRAANGAQLAEDQARRREGTARRWQTDMRARSLGDSVRNYQTGTALAGECQRIHGLSARCQRRPAITSAGLVREGASTPP
jgi:hypothetical protein